MVPFLLRNYIMPFLNGAIFVGENNMIVSHKFTGFWLYFCRFWRSIVSFKSMINLFNWFYKSLKVAIFAS